MELKPKEVQVLEQQWELLKVELQQLEDFYDRCSDCEGELDAIHEIQTLMSKIETGEYHK